MECLRYGSIAMAIVLEVASVAATAYDGHVTDALRQASNVSQKRLAFQQNANLPVEYRFIRPADFDDTPPPIPPSELWPAHH